MIRAGLGVFYNQDTGNAMYFDMARNIAARVTINAESGSCDPYLGQCGRGRKRRDCAGAAALRLRRLIQSRHLLHHAVSAQCSAAIWNGLGDRAGYLGSESHHLYGFQNLNQATPGTVGTIASRTAFKNFGVIQYVSDGLNAAYNSGSIKATRRFSQGLSFTSSYTFSKSIDESSGIRPQGFDTLFPQDNRCLSCERALSAFDTRHRFILGASYELPVGRGKALNVRNAVLDTIVGGWQTSGQYTLQSGVPQTSASAASTTQAPATRVRTGRTIPESGTATQPCRRRPVGTIRLPSSRLRQERSEMSAETP